MSIDTTTRQDQWRGEKRVILRLRSPFTPIGFISIPYNVADEMRKRENILHNRGPVRVDTTGKDWSAIR